MFCWNCGVAIDDGEKVCQICGEKQRHDEAEEADEAVKKFVGAMGKGLKTLGEILKPPVESAMNEMEKTLKKEAKKRTHNIMVKLKLAKETPLDKAEKIWKKIKK